MLQPQPSRRHVEDGARRRGRRARRPSPVRSARPDLRTAPCRRRRAPGTSSFDTVRRTRSPGTCAAGSQTKVTRVLPSSPRAQPEPRADQRAGVRRGLRRHDHLRLVGLGDERRAQRFVRRRRPVALARAHDRARTLHRRLQLAELAIVGVRGAEREQVVGARVGGHPPQARLGVGRRSPRRRFRRRAGAVRPPRPAPRPPASRGSKGYTDTLDRFADRMMVSIVGRYSWPRRRSARPTPSVATISVLRRSVRLPRCTASALIADSATWVRATSMRAGVPAM